MELEQKNRLRAVLSSFGSQRKREPTEPSLSPDEIRFKSLLVIMEDEFVSFRQAVKIVGGTVRLYNLMDEGKVNAVKPEGAMNTKWKINAADCYRNIKPRLGKIVSAI